MKREKRDERVFKSRGRAKETGKICGVSKRQVLHLKSKHDSDHVDETGIEREISEVSKNTGALLELKTVQITIKRRTVFILKGGGKIQYYRDCQQSQLSSLIMQDTTAVKQKNPEPHHKLEKRTNSRLVTKKRRQLLEKRHDSYSPTEVQANQG